MEHSISIIEDFDGRKIVLIHDIRFKGKRKINWKEVEGYLKEKHKKDAKNGWYRYTSNFALTVYDENEMVQRYNVFRIEMLVRHAKGGKMYLYDMVNIKKRTAIARTIKPDEIDAVELFMTQVKTLADAYDKIPIPEKCFVTSSNNFFELVTKHFSGIGILS